MNVILINGSPHAKGCTYTALCQVAGALNESGIETEIIQAGDKNLRGCTACGVCMKSGACVFNDFVNEVSPKLNECNGIVIGSPVYYASANGGLIAFLDRLFYSNMAHDKTMKVGASVVSARRAGCTAAFDGLNKYFSISGMPIVSSEYWNMVHGRTAEDVLKDEEGLRTMRVLGKNMAFLIKSIAIGIKQYGLPQKEDAAWTNFIR
jgi:multimeric flavodoxin WrbA